MFVIFTVVYVVTRCTARLYDGNDFYISENTTTFIEIPESCQLFGTQISEPISANKFALMTNETGRSVWVSAKLQFQKKVNPLGGIPCTNANKVKNFSECFKRCDGHKYFSHSVTRNSCKCLRENNGIRPLFNVLPNRNALKAVGKDRCVAYEYAGNNFKCETITSPEMKYNLETCSNRREFGYVCNEGFNKSLSNGITWFEAFEKCKEHGGLLHSDQANLLANIQKGTYWISYFRRPEYYLAKVEQHDVCIAADIKEGGDINLTISSCNERLPALCLRNSVKNGTEIRAAALLYGLGSTVLVVCLFIVIACLVYKKFKKKGVQSGISPTTTGKENQKQCEINENQHVCKKEEQQSDSLKQDNLYSMASMVNTNEDAHISCHDDYDHSSYSARRNVENSNYSSEEIEIENEYMNQTQPNNKNADPTYSQVAKCDENVYEI